MRFDNKNTNSILKFIFPCLIALLSNHSMGQNAPLEGIAGKWTNDIQITGSSNYNKSENFWWVGKLWGTIEPTGRMAFKSANGCLFEGLAYPSFSTFEGKLFVTNCSNPSMNRTYGVRLSKNGNLLSLYGTSTSMGIGRVDASYELKATLSPY